MNSFYHSTRSNADAVTSKQAIREGIAPDGGLYVRDDLSSKALTAEDYLNKPFKEISRSVLSRLLDDFTQEELNAATDAAYGDNFDASDCVCTSPLGTDWMLELFHGPTCAFKDIALQILPWLMSYARAGANDKIMVLTATSGDTGKAALDGFANVEGTGVAVFYPAGKVSDIQRLQMVCQPGDNVAVCGVYGNFDDTQSQVKAIFADHELGDRLATKNIHLSSANSINVGRLVPQISYYFAAYNTLVQNGTISAGEPLEYVVPTGNFGDVLAGYYAKLMGLPVSQLVVASNTNKVLTDFITTGIYNRKRPFHTTISPSMDILISSNLERLLYYLSGGDCEYVASLMNSLNEAGSYQLTSELLEKLQELFACGYADDEMTRASIKKTFDETGIVIDPHTAVAKHVADEREVSGAARVILSTASPYKFSASVLGALGTDTSGMNGFACMDALEFVSKTSAPVQLSSLRDAAHLHEDECEREKMTAVVEAACARIFL